MARTPRAKYRDYPVHTLEQALVVARAIVDKGAGTTMDRLLVADAMGRTPSSSEFRRLLSSSRKYGLTTGTEKADYISPTELALKIEKPEQEEDVVSDRVTACLTPPLFAKIYEHFNRNKLPEPAFLKNTLEKTFSVDSSLSEELANLIAENGEFCGIIQNISGSSYVRIDDPHQVVSEVEPERTDQEPEKPADESEPSSELKVTSVTDQEKVTVDRDRPRQLFVAHGKNRKPLDDLKKILDGFKIRYKVAVDEPHKGRPISAKVAELMNECSAGVFIFTRDEQFFRNTKDDNGKEEVWRPSENVVYELGAASILWEKKIIILKEDGVNFPSDFSDLGYITFKSGEIENRALDLLKELVGLELVKVEAV